MDPERMTGRKGWAVLTGVGVLAFVAGASGATLLLLGPMHYRSQTAAPAALVQSTHSPTVAQAPTASPGAGGLPVASAAATPAPGNGPRPRRYATWVFDPQAGNFLLFGGEYALGMYHEFAQALGDTWTWNGSTWSEVALTGAAPAARSDSATCFDVTHKVVVVHGGKDSNNTWRYNDIWTWDGLTWKLLSPDKTPTALGPQPMAWDPVSGAGYDFVFSGLTPGQAPDETWQWNGTTWSQVATVGAPTGHNGQEGAMAYDPERRTIIYFDHINGQPATWTFDGTTWTKAATTSGTDSQHFTMAEDDARSNVVLFGENGDTWTWDGSRWTAQNALHPPAGRRGASMTYDPVHKVDVLFGGAFGSLATYKEYNDVWSWNGSDWTQVSAGS